MTNNDETPTQQRKRVRINPEVEIIRVNPPATAVPSAVARKLVATTVASHQPAIQSLVTSLSKQFNALQATLRQQLQTQERLNSDDFIPHSARLGFQLKAKSATVTESDAYKTIAATTETAKKAFMALCKQSIVAVHELEIKHTRNAIATFFTDSLSKILTMVLIEINPTNPPPVLAKFLYSIFNGTAWTNTDFSHVHLTKLQILGLYKGQADTELGNSTWTVTASEQELLEKAIPPFNILGKLIFYQGWQCQIELFAQHEVTKALEKRAREYLAGEATATAAMVIDSEAPADPKIIRNMINQQVNLKTAQLQAKINKLEQSLARQPKAAKASKASASDGSTIQKNDDRGATQQKKTSATGAPSTNKTKGKRKGKRNVNSAAANDDATRNANPGSRRKNPQSKTKKRPPGSGTVRLLP